MAETGFDRLINRYVDFCNDTCRIDPNLYEEYSVKRGLRDSNGRGVLTGLTEVSDVNGFKVVDGNRVPMPGKLYFRGYPVEELVSGAGGTNHGFEEITFLLLFGDLPTKEELSAFMEVLGELRQLPESFNRDVIMKAPSRDMMNVLQKCVLTLYSYDEDPNNLDIKNVLMQSLKLIAQLPVMAAYGYQAYRHYYLEKSLVIHRPKPELSTAENLLRLLRTDGKYTELEAKVLDVCLIIHAEHGGGNNSTFTCRVLTSSGTDPYSAYSSAICSLKGPRHGGANIKVINMLDNFKANIKHWDNEGEVADYMRRTIRKETNDGSGLIYGMGHAVYTISDPRAVILKKKAFELAKGREIEAEFKLLETIERLTPEIFLQEKGSTKTMCANVDMYSGLVYRMLGIPDELFTPLFAVARMAGWAAHRMEELLTGNRLIRPAYKAIAKERDYVKLEERE